MLDSVSSPGFEFDDSRTIWHILGGTHAVGYPTAEERDGDIKRYGEAAAFDGVDPESQIPRLCGAFESGGKYFLLVDSVRKRSPVTNSYAYAGLIMNPAKFMELARSGLFASIADVRRSVDAVLAR